MKVSDLIQLLSWCDRGLEVNVEVEGQYSDINYVTMVELNGKKMLMLNHCYVDAKVIKEIENKWS